MPKFTMTWKGWRFYVDGSNCVATNGTDRLTTPMPGMPSPQQSFFRATEKLRDDIRNRSTSRNAARG